MLREKEGGRGTRSRIRLVTCGAHVTNYYERPIGTRLDPRRGLRHAVNYRDTFLESENEACVIERNGWETHLERIAERAFAHFKSRSAWITLESALLLE